MDVLVCLSNYGDGQLACLRRVLDAYAAMEDPFHVFVIVDTTVPLDLSACGSRLRTMQFPFGPGIRHGLAFVHRQHVLENLENFDLFIYSENDILITQGNVEGYLRVSDRLPEGFVTGFLRYERRDADGEHYLIDAHPSFPTLREKALDLAGRRYFALHNVHQGSWILTREQLRSAVASGGFVEKPHYAELDDGVIGILECAASDVYRQCGFRRKVFPHEGFEDLLVHHLPDKYVRQGGIWQDPGPLTVTQLRRRLSGEVASES